MTVVSPPAWLQQGTYPARTDRLVMSSLVASSGRVSPSDLVVTQSLTPGMRVTVSAGRAWILGTSVSYQGAYNFVNDAPVDVNIAASSTLNPRKDVVIARIQDAAVSGAVNSATIEVVTGTASASPVIPAIPSNSLILAVVAVAANASSIITANIDTSMVLTASLFSQMKNDVQLCTSTTRPTGADRYVGARIFETNTQREWMWNGANWAYRGGLRAPVAHIFLTGSIAWGNISGEIYNMAPASDSTFFDTNYYSFVNGSTTSSGDGIRVTQSGNYIVEHQAFVDRAGPYFMRIYSQVGSIVSGSNPQYAESGSDVASGWSILRVTNFVYLNAGEIVRTNLYTNASGTTLHSGYIKVSMVS